MAKNRVEKLLLFGAMMLMVQIVPSAATPTGPKYIMYLDYGSSTSREACALVAEPDFSDEAVASVAELVLRKRQPRYSSITVATSMNDCVLSNGHDRPDPTFKDTVAIGRMMQAREFPVGRLLVLGDSATLRIRRRDG